ncbi:bifunctional diguanylate cyclase/phosphodiesterase [Anaerosinus gibii]|uniref:EAL domain-containing protein n=1 Tax=Selenobaculum gibii TaxID=3054208 RepID=A0A9Y2AK37_9FIRM|nr:EAL domain-containing protein [Selenobaculum gbiensis]WIW71173.1 EAL domain-containing protein [Selenobaculum gbiensis]
MNNKARYNHCQIWFVGLFISIACILSCGLYIYNIQSDMEDDVLRDIRNLMLRNSLAIANKLNDQSKLTEMLAAGLEQRNYSNENEYALFLNSIVMDGAFERVGVFDKNGDMFTSDKKKLNIADEPQYKESMEGRFSISQPINDKIGDKKIIVFTAPILSKNRAYGGIVLAKSIESIEKEFLQGFFQGRGSFYIIDNKGDILMCSESLDENSFENLYDKIGHEESNEKNSKKIIEEIKSSLVIGKVGTVKSVFDGETKYISYATIHNPYTSWNLVSIVDEEVILNKIHKMVTKAFVLCSVVILLFLIMAGYIFRMEEKTKHELEQLAYTDSLTKINNVHRFYIKASEILRRNKDIAYSIICIDVNNFKYINETYGYKIGDQLLIQIAQKLSDTFKDDEICARINNDHFVVLIKSVFENPEVKYQSLERAFLNEINQGIIKYPISFSVGVYRVEDKSEAVISMVDKALLTLKNIKKRKNIYFAYYSNDLLQKFIKNNQIENMMQPALDNQEFKVFLQPKIDLHTLSIIGAEALVRWVSPSKGFMQPDDFIPLFEKNGFIVELDFYVLEECCKKIREWIDNGIEPIPISVNQSRINLDDPFYVEKLNDILQKYELPVNLIEIELTEGMFSSSNTKLVKIMERMRKIGFSISMDDFGSGYSSLNLLKEIPVDILKIDKVFLDETANSRKSRIIISQVVSMARKLGMKVVCEGVENEEQAAFLRKIHCDFAQGYLYAKPMTIADFEEYRDRNLKEVGFK